MTIMLLTVILLTACKQAMIPFWQSVVTCQYSTVQYQYKGRDFNRQSPRVVSRVQYSTVLLVTCYREAFRGEPRGHRLAVRLRLPTWRRSLGPHIVNGQSFRRPSLCRLVSSWCRDGQDASCYSTGSRWL